MKIVEVKSIPLSGWSDDTGWDFKLDPGENQHTLIQIKTKNWSGSITYKLDIEYIEPSYLKVIRVSIDK